MSSENPIAVVLEQTQDRFVSIAPQHMKYDSERGFALQILKGNDYLMKAAMSHPSSLQSALVNVAAIGLSLNPAEKQAYLIARNVKNGNQWNTKVFLEPSYMGLIKLATDSGSIKWCQAACAYSNDTFMDNGAGEKPTHQFNAFAKIQDRGEFVGVYCVAKTVDGDYLTTTMTREEIESIRDRSEAWKAFKEGKTKSGGPWQSDFNEQAKKTVIRRAFKTWPRTNLHQMAQAVELSNENEGFEPIISSPALGQYTADQKEYFDQLIVSSDALGMYCFQHSLSDESIFVNLYHSFEKGQKGKYQAIVKDLSAKGFSLFEDCLNAIEDAAQSGDDMAARQVFEELNHDGQKIMVERISKQARDILGV